jgi:hypothetical protein
MLVPRPTQAREPPLGGFPRLLIQYIRNYPPYVEAFVANLPRNTDLLEFLSYQYVRQDCA